ncbi:MAG: AAA family ATPase [Clostridia bacterium]|nr:AAA family ATPase [Clostridia bacterium]
MKLLKPEKVAMKDRIDWLKAWVKGRDYDIGEHRNDYLYVYYSTLRMVYSPRNSHHLLHHMNSYFKRPLSESSVDKIISNIEKKQSPSRYRNKDIISKLGITQDEIELLRIGHNKQETQERAKRKAAKEQRNNDIAFMYAIGYKVDEIAAEHPEISKRTIQRFIAEQRQKSQTDHERNLMVAEIIRLYQAEYSITGIARQMGSSNDEVCRILGLESMTKLTILETKRQLSESPQFKTAECQELFYCSLSKETNTQSGIDEHTIAMAALRTDKNNIALIGAAGTGKSTLVRNFLSKLSPEERAATLVVAPTGRAADHLDAQTIHKAFQLPNDVQPNDEVTAAPKALYSISRLIIDEINMVRIDVFTKVIKTIRFIEQQTDKHIQVIVVGDFGQIQPVTTDEDMDVIKFYYPEAKGVYAFQSELWEQMNFRKIVLKYIYRQQEPEFMQRLNEIKYGKLSAVDWFNKNAGSLFSCNPIYICPTNKLVDYYNKQAEDRFFPDELVSFDAVITDGTPQEAELPCPRQLRLAVGMRIMTICNADKFKNGSMGRIIKIKPNSIQVRFDNGAEVTISTMRFKLQDGGIYEQLPVVLAYAITANKSEGMTFDEINVVPGYFAPGQLYTVLSRCKSLKNIHIIGKLSEKDLIVDVAALEMTI